MLIRRLTLEDIKSYHHFTVDFRCGTTAISGKNGAGKTTLVEAIGFALFDYLPYSQARFVREGEKHGRVVVQLVGSDERPYMVERRCGSGARWFIYDEEAHLRIEQGTDVLDKLHELFGIDRERPLASLFRDALGVPQGTFTSIFLEPASKRKQTFDALLQIEDYKASADYLLETQRVYKDQRQAQQEKINQLGYETRELEDWQQELKEARQRGDEWEQLNAQWVLLIAHSEGRFLRLTEQANQLHVLKNCYATSRTRYENDLKLLAQHERQLQEAQKAQQIVDKNCMYYERYLQAEETLQCLRQDDQRRNNLLRQRAELDNMRATVQANLDHLQARLEEVAAARQEIAMQVPLVERQIELEKRRENLLQKVTRYTSLVAEGKQLTSRLKTYQDKKGELEHKIAEIAPLVPAADRLQEHIQTRTQLYIQRNESKNKMQRVREKRNLLQEKCVECEQSAERLRKAENAVAAIEEHRAEAQEMPELQRLYEHLSAQRHRLEGNIEGYARSRVQSAGGQCPLLHESCLNIKQRGMVSLESYFAGLLKEEHAQLAEACQQQEVVTEQIGRIKKYADALHKLEQYKERRDGCAEQLQRTNLEIVRLEYDIASLLQDLEAFKSLEQQISELEASYNESRNAALKVRDLSGFQRQVQQLQEQIQQSETDLQERRQDAASLSGSEAQLEEVNAELLQLNDPRSHSKVQQAIIMQEGNYLRQQRTEQQKNLEIQQKLQILQEQLAAYDTLDVDIAMQDSIRRQCQPGYQSYLKNVEIALTLSAREHTCQRQLSATEQARQTLQEAEQAYYTAQANFDESELAIVKSALDQLCKDQIDLAAKMELHQRVMHELEKKIQETEAKLIELEAAQKVYQELNDLHTMTEYFRKLIKEAAPYVLKAMLQNISAEANRIFGEIMGDRSALLSWQNDYEVVLRRQGINRTFAQLSGGEQMSAALAVRLALLKKLSTLNIAFFDEPTQNMDELRRVNLAEQIRRVRGFDQLIVISHDDTFEQGLDSLIHLQKDDGETRLAHGDIVSRETTEELTLWNKSSVSIVQ